MKALLCAVCLLCVVAVPIVAQEAAKNKPADNMDIVRDALRAEKKLFIAENMHLTESEAQAFWPVYEEYQNGLKKIVDRDMKLIEMYAQNYESMTDEVADKMIKDYMAIEKDFLQLRQQFLPKFSKALPPTKVARYYQLENKIKAVAEFDMATQIPVIPVGGAN